MIKAVLFDLDETLYDHQHSVETMLRVLAVRWPPLGQVPLPELFGRYQRLLDAMHPRVMAGEITPEQSNRLRMRELLKTVGVEPTDEELQDFRPVAGDAYRANRRAVPGAIALLAELRRRTVKIGVVTNNFVDEQMRKLDACGLTTLVDVLAISEEVRAIKPDPRIFAAALARAGVRPNEAVMVGDSWANDVEGARAAGILPVWFNRSSAASPDSSVRELRGFEPVAEAAAILLGTGS